MTTADKIVFKNDDPVLSELLTEHIEEFRVEVEESHSSLYLTLRDSDVFGGKSIFSLIINDSGEVSTFEIYTGFSAEDAPAKLSDFSRYQYKNNHLVSYRMYTEKDEMGCPRVFHFMKLYSTDMSFIDTEAEVINDQNSQADNN